MAEVASTCNEILLMEYLLANTTDKKERAYLLNHYLDSFKGTVYRQTMFAEFEMKSNQMAEAGESLNAENLCKLYYGLNQKYFGEDMVSDPQIAYEWARIPHFTIILCIPVCDQLFRSGGDRARHSGGGRTGSGALQEVPLRRMLHVSGRSVKTGRHQYGGAEADSGCTRCIRKSARRDRDTDLGKRCK